MEAGRTLENGGEFQLDGNEELVELEALVAMVYPLIRNYVEVTN